MAFEPFYNEEAKSSDALDNHLKGKDPFGMNSVVVNQWEEWLSKDKLEKNLAGLVSASTFITVNG